MARSVDAVFIGRFVEHDVGGVGRSCRGIDLSEVCPAPGCHVLDIRLNDADIESLRSQGADMGLRAGDELCVRGDRTVGADGDKTRIVFLSRPEDSLQLVSGGIIVSIHEQSPVVRDTATVEAIGGGVPSPQAPADVAPSGAA